MYVPDSIPSVPETSVKLSKKPWDSSTGSPVFGTRFLCRATDFLKNNKPTPGAAGSTMGE